MHPRVPDLVRTTIDGEKVGACGASALSALQTYFFHKDDVTNLRATMRNVMTSHEISYATRGAKESLDEAKSTYDTEMERLRAFVK